MVRSILVALIREEATAPAVEGRGPNHWNPSFWNSFSSGLVVLSSLSVSLPKMSSFSERIFGDVEF